VIVASIDIGTNTLRLLIADLQSHPSRTGWPAWVILHEDRRITRLGEAIHSTGRLKTQAMARTLSALRAFKSAVDRHAVEAVVCVGTSAVRETANGLAFVGEIRRKIGLEVEVIEGQEEARRTLLGIEWGLGETPDTLLAVDIGGGSTELIAKVHGQPTRILTTSLGVVKLAEQYLRSDPLSPEDQQRLISAIETPLKAVWEELGMLKDPVVVGTAGTVTTLAAMQLGLIEYDPERVQNFRMTREQVEAWFRRLSGLPLAERCTLPGLERGREDLIVAGAAILMVVLRRARVKEWVVSDAGLREGLLVDWWQRH
jgi:exopolyphosphatase/guanosine-5'-triphosphate,3'-diphosphate pyrophosphatase